ncbi:MAG: peptidoglycan editing factor PgeF [Snowella sp.]|nr:peptidoglycan editing factor PgeF [Snowella sp.]
MTNSPVRSDWQWQEWQGRRYLTCSLLQDWQHGFFTQDFYPDVPEILVTVLQPQATVFRVKQVHGDRLLTPTEIQQAKSTGENEESWPAADGIISDQSQQAVWVASADCTPVLVGDRVTGRVSAIHAGWRGTAQKIVPKAIQRFLALGSQLSHLRIAMGPAIAGSVYQVDQDVAAEVGASLFLDDPKPPTEILEILANLTEPPILSDPEAGKVRLDVRRINALQLDQLGLQPDQIAIAPYCTYQIPEHFFSYRRTKEKKVQWSGIMSGQGK